MDTVIVDAGDEILAAGSNMFSADVTPDKKYLLNLDQKTHNLEIVDLDKLVLDRKVKFEKEGPNVTGDFVNFLIALPGQKIAFTSYMNSAIFDYEGKRSSEMVGGNDPLNPHCSYPLRSFWFSDLSVFSAFSLCTTDFRLVNGWCLVCRIA
jgi:hypothetical protein